MNSREGFIVNFTALSDEAISSINVVTLADHFKKQEYSNYLGAVVSAMQ